MNLSNKLIKKLTNREEDKSIRNLEIQENEIDFFSNDYLGLSKSKNVFQKAHQYLVENQLEVNGATGSRLLSGNHSLFQRVEDKLCKFHNSEAALVFNSGYDANLGFFSSVLTREDIVLYDEYIHASIRDGITISNSKSYKFKHNDLENLAETIEKVKKEGQTIYIVTESVFSMDGDSPDLISLTNYCTANGFYLIVDEAHAIGVFGENGRGEIQRLGLENQVFARVITFGKALGCHGAAILGGSLLRDYLINFSRSFIYTTSLPPHSLATLLFAYQEMEESDLQNQLNSNIELFKNELVRLKLQPYFIESTSAIQSCVINGSNRIKKIATHIQEKGFNIKPILPPTVPLGSERLRFCIHSYNSKKEISEVLELLATFVSK
jgi:8-amino-7-oxononanoate synthase